MAIETLKGVESLAGFNVVVMDDLRDKFPDKFSETGSMDWQWFEKDIRPNHFIYVRHDKNSIAFTLQNGPIKENGVNGCQVDALVAAARTIIYELNKKFPFVENAYVIKNLDDALHWLDARRRDRDKK